MDVWTNILEALPLVFALDVVIAMLAGTVIGIVVGALPGLSATMGIAVLIPLTFTMQPLVALGMIAGIYNGAMYGGAIPAILVRIPGTPAGIATVFDGYPMAQQGQGALALRIALVSSALGSFLSAICLLLLAPPLASIALSFGPAEYFWLAIFGLTCIAVLLSDSPIKGLLSTCFGLLMGLVGIDQITGNERFTFDSIHLIGGLNIIVVLTGLYAIPPALELAEKALSIRSEDLQVRDDHARFRWRSLVPTWARSSVIGVIIGIIPGAGGNIASIIAWNETRRAARNPERFGKGAPEGVAAAECANNADTAATLIPALTLGVPGNAVAAVILGALLVHGLRPGPALFRDTADITYGFMLAMGVTAIMMLVVGQLGARLFINVLRISPLLLAPMIVSLTVIGVYTVNNSMAEVWIMLGLGMIGYGMEKLAIPTAPAVLAIILGPMAESELRRALLLGRGDPVILITNPISIILAGLTVLVLCAPLLRKAWAHWHGARAGTDIAGPDHGDPGAAPQEGHR
jgi:putative tricarboxylic transport membrane protein